MLVPPPTVLIGFADGVILSPQTTLAYYVIIRTGYNLYLYKSNPDSSFDYL